MNINPDDPALTAFALGELSGPEREAMARAVAASPEAQAQVEEIQALAGLLRRDFRLERGDPRRHHPRPVHPRILPRPSLALPRRQSPRLPWGMAQRLETS